MATITLQDVPDAIYDQLRRRAQEHGWTVDLEAFNCLAAYLSKGNKRDQRDVERLLEEIRTQRDELRGFVPTKEDAERSIKETNRDLREVERLLEEIRTMHEGMKGDFYSTAEEVDAAINDGRE